MSNRNDTAVRQAILTSAARPGVAQWSRMEAFLRERYGEDVELVWQKDASLRNGFRLEIGDDVYDWSLEGRMRQLAHHVHEALRGAGDVIPLLRSAIEEWQPEALAQNTGTVLTVEDGIATVSGLPDAFYGEILIFSDGVRGMVQNLERDEIGCILFGDDSAVEQGSPVYRTNRVAGIPVGEGFLGRVVDALGSPIDGGAPVEAEAYRPMESPAPDIIARQPVNQPMETGLIAIDSMFPIGRGQRELIIGDRQTGKTAVALDTILNQRGKDVVCIYVAIGQKASSVSQLVNSLRRRGAMDYTIVVNASASDPAPLQYVAPYAGCAMGEYFMEKGQDVLIVYDDLSKHAVAYRALSLLLGRSPGREAYPGDVFYLHSRLLERAAHLSDELGGGSMTALPIVETQAGDVSAYIPTNIISITDGQLFLESDLFFSGQRPAVNIGLSVSRVGGDAQTPAMKRATGSIRLDLAQYREMEVFTQFSSDLDESTRRQLRYGQGLMRLLRQKQYHPLQQHEQVILLIAAQAHAFLDFEIDEIESAAQRLLAHVSEAEHALCQKIDQAGSLSPEERAQLKDSCVDFLSAEAAKKKDVIRDAKRP